MSDASKRAPGRWWLVLPVSLVLVGGAAGAYALLEPSPPPSGPPLTLPPEADEACADSVEQFCGACHAVPPPDSFPRHEWRKQMRQAYGFFHESRLAMDYPSIESVCRYYEKRAPEELPVTPPAVLTADPSQRWEARGLRPPGPARPPGVTNVTLAHLSDPKRLDVIVCDANRHEILAVKPYTDPPQWRTLGHVLAPAHAEVVDLDGDGIPDLIVASLGEFYPTDAPCGGVVWLRGRPDGTYTPYTLLDHVGRVADVQAADFYGRGRKDLLVAVFGWQKSGAILLLENLTTDPERPKFVPHVLDDRHGTIHVPVADLNGDGRPDFVALISQEHEKVVAFLNEGGGRFTARELYAAPHPAYGSSGIQLADLNGDGKLDVLYTNGDVMDPPHTPRPDHHIQWLENRTADWQRPVFERHVVAVMPGVERALAADLSGTGRLDLVAVSFLPAEMIRDREARRFASVMVLRQTRPGVFEPHVLETTTCDHFTCAVGDLFGDGKKQLVVGNFSMTGEKSSGDALSVWRNLGPR